MAQGETEVKILKYSVDGEWRESTTDKYMDVTDSSTGEVFAKAPVLHRGRGRRRRSSPLRRRTRPGRRCRCRSAPRCCTSGKLSSRQHEDELAYICSREVGKNLDEARGEIVKIIEGCEVGVAAPMIAKGESLMNVSTGHDTVSYREPLGVFAGIAPFNFPAMIPFGWMIPLCIVTGNTFVLKAASMVPTSVGRACSSCSTRPVCPRASSTW